MSKTVEEAFEEWYKATHLTGWSSADHHDHDKSSFAVGAAHGAAMEREACAELCEHIVTTAEEHDEFMPNNPDDPCGFCNALELAAARIRQRGEKRDG